MSYMYCIHHPNYRWLCKKLSISDGRYNGLRNLHWMGRQKDNEALGETTLVHEGEGIPECKCPAADLREIKE
jgi:hypothetical protein